MWKIYGAYIRNEERYKDKKILRVEKNVLESENDK
jgi:hypothetical protein